MIVYVKSQISNIYTLEVESSDTVYDVIAMIQRKNGLPPKVQRPIFAGKLLDVNCALAHYDIQMYSVLYLVR
jgi:hypothetical protein